ncbi:MAG: TIM barrel protein [Candidatus Thermoplasmatota archaeon]|nr:TIM barrel protein [Candidatus Thermoplasmatota archaeon]
MIRYGPSGIPLSCKGRTLFDGIEDVHLLGLTALEVQMIRTNVSSRLPDDEEIGRTPAELETDMIVQIERGSGKNRWITNDPQEKIRQGDSLLILESGLCHSYIELYEMAEYARDHDVQLSVHSSYYVDLSGRTEMVERSKNNLKWAGLVCNALGGVVTSTQLGFYGSRGRKAGTEQILKNLRSVRDWWKENKISAPIGIETSGRQEVFGGLDEVIDAVRRVKGTVPVINFAHLHSRENGSLREPEDFRTVISKVRKVSDDLIYTSFSGVEHYGGNELRLTPIKRGDLRFEPLAELIVEENYDMTIISCSPLLEHDAIYMKVIFERILSRQVTKEVKEKV